MSAVLFTEHALNDGRCLLEITLNAEAALNALNLEMIAAIRTRLEQAEQDTAIAAIMLKGAGEKAFCAGGDVVKLYRAIEEQAGREAIDQYFIQEYAMDYMIHRYSKPVICWANGVVMGGGMGIMNGCSHRIVTEKSRLAMPEISIGLYPDVGASWFLNHTYPELGLFLGLTAYRMQSADALYMRLADLAIDSSALAQVRESLVTADWGNCAVGDEHVLVSQVLERCAKTHPVPEATSWLQQHSQQITALCSADNVIEVVVNLLDQPLQGEVQDQVWQRCQQTLQAGSSLAAHLIFQQLKNSRKQSLSEVFVAEMILSANCCAEPELAEGIRALLVDKDGRPNWLFKSVASVDSDYVAKFFRAPWLYNPLSAELVAIENR